MGPFKFVSVYNVTQVLFSKDNRVEMHAYDEKSGDHLVSQFTCQQVGSNVVVSYEEAMLAGFFVVTFGAKPIETARMEHLDRLNDRVRQRIDERKRRSSQLVGLL